MQKKEHTSIVIGLNKMCANRENTNVLNINDLCTTCSDTIKRFKIKFNITQSTFAINIEAEKLTILNAFKQEC